MKVQPYHLIIRTWLGLLALILTAWFVINNVALLLELIWILFGGFILSVVIRPVADLLLPRHIPRGVTVLAAYLLLLAATIAIVRVIVPIVTVEAGNLRQTIPDVTQNLLGQFANTPFEKWLPTSAGFAQEVNNQLDTLIFGALNTVAGITSFFLDLFVLLIVTYFFVTTPLHSQHPLWLWLETTYRDHLLTIFRSTYNRLKSWVWTQLLLGLYHGVAFIGCLLLLHVPFAFTIGLLGGILSLIPYFGVTLATLLATLSVLPVDPWLALWVLLAMSTIATVGNHVITPILFGRTVGLNSLVVLIALYIGAQLEGILGMIFAIPVAIMIDTVLHELIFALDAKAKAVTAEPV